MPPAGACSVIVPTASLGSFSYAQKACQSRNWVCMRLGYDRLRQWRRSLRRLKCGVSSFKEFKLEDWLEAGSSSEESRYWKEPLKKQDGVYSYAEELPTQAESVVGGTATAQAEYKSIPDLDYLQELLAIQQQGPRAIGFFGTRNMGYMHQQLIEILSYAMVITKNHIFTSGASGTNAAVIRGALRAERPDLLTVILPQSLKRQSPESQELLSKVKHLVEKPHNDHLPLLEASRLCNMDILSHVQQVICFAFHDSKLLMETCREAKELRKIVTLFYLD